MRLCHVTISTHTLLSSDEITALELENLRDDSEDGYIYEVNLHYPTKLHNQHDVIHLLQNHL